MRDDQTETNLMAAMCFLLLVYESRGTWHGQCGRCGGSGREP